jgi:hypothetical protein
METGSSHESHDHKRHHPTHLPVVDFNPVQNYLRELQVQCTLYMHMKKLCMHAAKVVTSKCIEIILQAAFSEFCLFFYDAYGGEFIAVVWKSPAFQPQSFKVHVHV